MRFKVSYLLPLLVLAVLWGCRKESPYPDDRGTEVPISFGAGMMGMEVETKAEAWNHLTTDEDFQNNPFRVFGTWTTPNNSQAQVFNNTQNVSYNSTSSQWEYSPVRYWQFGGSYDFTAVYPSTANCLPRSNGKTLLVQYTMHEDYDLIVAGARRNLSDDQDEAYDISGSSVPLTFRHACAALQFRFRSASGENVTTYYLRSFELKYIKAAGTLIYSSGDGAIDVGTTNWYPSQVQSGSVFSYNDVDLGQVGAYDIPKISDWNLWDSDVDGKWKMWHYAIPQDMQADPATHQSPTLHFTVTVGNSSSPVDTYIPLPQQYPSDYPVEELRNQDIVWKPGQVYIYQVLVEPTSASITVSTTDWTTATMVTDPVIF